MPGAPVRARNVSTGLERTTAADASGRYSFPLMQPGRYSLVVSTAGFAAVTRENVETKAGQTVTIDIAVVPRRSARR